MIFSEDIKNRMVSMIDYIMARSAEFGGIEVRMSSIKVDGATMFNVFLGTMDDGAEMFHYDQTNERWMKLWKGRESEWRKI